MKTPYFMILAAASFLGTGAAFGQGFINLDFERAQITNVVFGVIPATNAFPGWTVTAPYVFYNDASLSGGSISLLDTNPPSSLPPIQGRNYAFLVSAGVPGYGSISLGQTGHIPLWARSITFWVSLGQMQVTFNNQALSFNAIATTANYSVYGADLSAYAGQVGQLLFTMAPLTETSTLDNIQFSPSVVPEPSRLVLAALSTLLLCFRRWNKSEH